MKYNQLLIKICKDLEIENPEEKVMQFLMQQQKKSTKNEKN